MNTNPNPYLKIYDLIRNKSWDIALKTLLRENGQLKSLYRANLNHSYYVLGSIYFEIGEYGKAAKKFARSASENPSDTEAMLALANCYDALKKPKLAEKALRTAITTFNSGTQRVKTSIRYSVYLNLGNALFDQKKYSEAIDMYGLVRRSKTEAGKRAIENIKLCKSIMYA